jgi:hypothetical protein
MTKTIFLKKSLESELKSNERFNGISTIEIPLKEEQSTHIYQSSGNYIADHLGQIVLTFSNETAWYWNKDLELTLKVGSRDGELKPITLEESGEYSLIRNGDEVEISKNGDTFLIKNIKKRFNLGVNLNTGDIISWNINVLNKNSIDFKAEFKIDYLKILKKTLERNVDNEKVELLNKELKLKKQTINEYKTITYELNTKINSEKISNNNLSKVIEIKDKLLDQKNLLFKLNQSNNDKFRRENEELKRKNAELRKLLERKSMECEDLTEKYMRKHNQNETTSVRNLYYKSQIKSKNELLEKKYFELMNSKKQILNLEFKMKTAKHEFAKKAENNEKVIDDLVFIIDNKDYKINNLKNNIINNLDLVKQELKTVKDKFTILQNKCSKQKIAKYENFNIDMYSFEEAFKSKVLKRHIFILEKKINKVVKNKKLSDLTVVELSKENVKLLRINHINKNNEKKLRDNLNKAKIRINQEVNYAKKYKDKLTKIKNKFI